MSVITNILPHSWTDRIGGIGADPDDDEESRLQKQLLIIGSFLIVPATAVWGTIYFFFEEPLAGGISIFYSIFTLIELLYFGITRRYRLILLSQLVLGLVLPFLQMIVLGGFSASSAVVLWSLISPMGALLLYDHRTAARWWLVYLAILIAGGFLQPSIRSTNNLPLSVIDTLFVMNLAAFSGIFYLVLNYFLDRLKKTLNLLKIEQEKSENLLLNILPREIAAILKNESRTIADQFDGASILFADLVGFTPLTAEMEPVEMVNLLNEIFSHFDSLVEKYDLEKIRTIGDNYMVASGAPRQRPDHAHALAHLALEMSEYLHNRPADRKPVEFRIGINSGPVIGGVIGRKKFVYDLWGDAVNIASRMESQGLPGQIQITQHTYELIHDAFICQPRGEVNVKGKGSMRTWFLVGVKDDQIVHG